MAPPSNFPSNQEKTPVSIPILQPQSLALRGTPSFSSESSFESLFSSTDEYYPAFSPRTPLNLKGIPFSWEQIPGIPKHQEPKKNTNKEYSGHLLPLPPAGKLIHRSATRPFQRDPFSAALVKCSKDDDNHGLNFGNLSSKITMTLSDRLGLVGMYAFCKSNCVVSDSIVRQSRLGPHYLVYRHSR